MSKDLIKIIDAVNNEIAPLLPGTSSEKQRIEIRRTLLALERMVKSVRFELLKESKEIKATKKLAREKKKSDDIKEKENSDDHSARSE